MTQQIITVATPLGISVHARIIVSKGDTLLLPPDDLIKRTVCCSA
jgi:hypothetical protein